MKRSTLDTVVIEPNPAGAGRGPWVPSRGPAPWLAAPHRPAAEEGTGMRDRQRERAMASETSFGFALRPSLEAMSEVGYSHESLPLNFISGLHKEAEIDLKRIGIMTVENLAVANPMLLLVK